MLFGDRDIAFREIAGSFSEDISEQLEVSPFAEVSRNIVSMANYLPAIEGIIRTKAPQSICEIGAYRGITTTALLKISESLGATLHVVDPSDEFLNSIKPSGSLIHHKVLSEEFLARGESIQLYFLDGDHNYEVVTKELFLISQSARDVNSPLIFMHDVGWPWGARDLYYDKSRVSQVHDLDDTGYLNIAKGSGFEISIPVEQDFARNSGGKRNGVRCAALDFVSSQTDWRFLSIPSLFGLGILYNQKKENAEVLCELEKFEQAAKVFRRFLAVLELNRLLLLSEIDKQGTIWNSDHKYLEALEVQIRNLSERVAFLESGKGALKQLIHKLTKR